MSYDLPKSALEWKNKIHSFVQNELVQWEIEAEMNRGEIPAEASIKHRKIAIDMGLPGMDAPKEKGGLGLSMLDQVVIWEELGKVTNALCWCFSEAQSWMYEACSDEQIKNYINPLLRGEKKECYAITESESGSNVDGGINTTAILDGDFYILNGEKWYVTGANKADFLFVQAKIGKGKNKDKHVLFLLDKDTKGLELLSSPLFSHTYSFHHPTYKLNNIKVPVKNLIGKEGDGLKYTYSWFRHERLMIAARCCGASERLIEEATTFAKERKSKDGTISDYQAIQFMLADSVTELWAARLMLYETAKAHDKGADEKELHSKCSIVKLYASEVANKIADRAVQIFGGRGYMRENSAERYFRELRVDRIWEGTSEIHKIIIANSLYKRGLKIID